MLKTTKNYFLFVGWLIDHAPLVLVLILAVWFLADHRGALLALEIVVNTLLESEPFSF